jgi:uncharacterized protein (DUF2062 family)
MLFRRREHPGQWHRLRLWLWPRVSWRRSALYYTKRILRLSGTPHAIALGTAVGVFASFTPLIGFHFMITFAIAWALGGNMIAGAIATAIGNPLTYPLIWASTYEVGHLILKGASGSAPERLGHALTHQSFEQLLPLIKPMLVGSLPLGAAAGAIAYLLVHKAVSAYQDARRKRLLERGGAGRMAESGQKP